MKKLLVFICLAPALALAHPEGTRTEYGVFKGPKSSKAVICESGEVSVYVLFVEGFGTVYTQFLPPNRKFRDVLGSETKESKMLNVDMVGNSSYRLELRDVPEDEDVRVEWQLKCV